MYGRFTQTPTTTVGELLAWSYANLAMAHAAVAKGDATYGRKHYAIRTSYHKGLLLGKPFMRSLADDERLKLTLPLACTYCGSRDDLSVDHLISKKTGGTGSRREHGLGVPTVQQLEGGDRCPRMVRAEGDLPAATPAAAIPEDRPSVLQRA